MEGSCSFESLVGTLCSFDRRDKHRSTEIVPLSLCNKDVTGHRSTWYFSGIESETDFILARGIFSLGIGWRWNSYSNSCQVPKEIANHIERRGKPVKADRGVGKNISGYIYQQTGTLIPVGSVSSITDGDFTLYLVQDYVSLPTSTICVSGEGECRSFFKTANKDKVSKPPIDSLSSGVQRILLPSDSSSDSEETVQGTRSSRDKLNKFLASRDISPVRSQLKMPWDMASDRTQRFHIRKAKQVVDAALGEIAPQDTEKLWISLVQS
ncbi:unnamed protein product [Pocillopora meandrina]|uniref:Uncharacterized protein n=1 Tax=Pocillopora meandrina TaxID=46732 RepID=A0AAU9WSX3_9CNID|nr:unnamed protein product [Pocillopora meandrina]